MLVKRFNSQAFKAAGRSFSSLWSHVQQGPPDPIFGVTEAFNRDQSPLKVNLGVGAYRDDNGKPLVLESVKRGIQLADSKYRDFEYLPVPGLQAFTEASIRLAYGQNNNVLKEKRVAAVQALSGTGSLRLGAQFISKFLPENTGIYIPDETWANHKNIFSSAGLQIKQYRYYQPSTRLLNFEGLIEDLKNVTENSVILFHACAHNPTGVDPSQEEWRAIRDVLVKKKVLIFFDLAYQGFTSGDTEKDAYALRLFTETDLPIFLAQSYAKNFGLYGMRTGCFSAVCQNQEEAVRLRSQVAIIARGIWSNPPVEGARIVESVLNDQQLNQLWLGEVKEMADRISNMRQLLVQNLTKAGSPHDWSHITKQIGMFAFTGLQQSHVESLAKDYHLYFTKDGRISIAGINSKNVDYIAQSFDKVTRNSKL